MARAVPRSPALQEAALDAALARAATPSMPAGLAARIVTRATALPQIPADPLPEPEVVEAAPVTEAEVIRLAPAAPLSQQPRRIGRFAIAGLGAVAAGIAAIALVGQPSPQSGVPTGPAQAPALVAAPAPASVSGPTAPPAERLAAAPRQAVPTATGVKASSPAPVAAPEAPVRPEAATPEVQLATSGQRTAADPAGPRDEPGAAPRVVPHGGLMGPPAPQQGWGFSGGAPGGALPGGQPLPSQTTGTMPPPPPPGGHP